MGKNALLTEMLVDVGSFAITNSDDPVNIIGRMLVGRGGGPLANGFHPSLLQERQATTQVIKWLFSSPLSQAIDDSRVPRWGHHVGRIFLATFADRLRSF